MSPSPPVFLEHGKPHNVPLHPCISSVLIHLWLSLIFFLATYDFYFFVNIYKGHVLCLNSVCVFVCPVIVRVAQYGIDECDCTHIYYVFLK